MSPAQRENLRTVFFAVVLAMTFRTGVAQAYVVEGPSMEPTVFEGERLMVFRGAYGLSLPFVTHSVVSWSEPSVGDVVVVTSPLDGEDLVKRVIGVPGDVIEIREGVVFRNAEPFSVAEEGECALERQIDPSATCVLLSESTASRVWLTSLSDPTDVSSMPPVEVPPGHVFVLGDHRDRSNDSRRLGPIPASRLRGRVLFVE